MFGWIGLLLFAYAEEPVERICPEDGLRALVVVAREVERTFWELEVEKFEITRDQLHTLRPCVDDVVRVEDAIALHRAYIVESYVGGDLEAVKRSFGAVRALDPEWLPPAPEGHPIWSLFHEAPLETLPAKIVVMPPGGWAVDGTRFETPSEEEAQADEEAELEEAKYTLPANRSFVLQVFGEDERVLYTGYHYSAVDIPIEDLVVLPNPEELRRRRRKLARRWGTVVGSSLLAGAAVTLGVGLSDRQRVASDSVPPGDVPSVQLQGNILGWTSAGLGVLGATSIALGWGVRW